MSASVWGCLCLASASSSGGGVCFIDGRLMYAGGGPAYLGPTCLALGAGSGVSLVTTSSSSSTCLTSRRRLWAPTAPSAGASACTSPRRGRFSFFLAAPPFVLAFFRGYVLDAGGLWGATFLKSQWAATPWGPCWAGGRGGVGGEGCSISTGWTEARQSCWRLGLLELGFWCRFTWCRLAVVDGLKRRAVAVDDNYTIYGTSTGLVEVYEGAGWSTSPVLSVSSAGLAYETSAGVSLVISLVRVVTNCGSWTAFVERGVVYRLLQVRGRGRGAFTCPTKASSSHLSEAVLRQVDLAASLRGAEGLEVPRRAT